MLGLLFRPLPGSSALPAPAAAPWPSRAAPSSPGLLAAGPVPRPRSSGAVVAASPAHLAVAGSSSYLSPLCRAASSGLVTLSACPLPLALPASAGPLHLPDAVRDLDVDLLVRVDWVAPPDFGGHQSPHRPRRVHHSPVSYPRCEEVILDVVAECCQLVSHPWIEVRIASVGRVCLVLAAACCDVPGHGANQHHVDTFGCLPDGLAHLEEGELAVLVGDGDVALHVEGSIFFFPWEGPAAVFPLCKEDTVV